MKQDIPGNSVAVVGLGYVGLPLALLAKRKGYSVVGVDIDQKKVDMINAGQAPFKDGRVAEDLHMLGLRATSDFSAIRDASIVVICVPTPVYENHLPDLRPVQGATEGIGPYIQKGQLIVLESTVNPGISESVVLPILEQLSSLRGGTDFYLAHVPERINPGDEKWNVENIPRVVGGLEETSLSIALAFYRSLLSAKVKPMGSLKEAEAVKVVENSFRDINIAFVNELAMSFAKLGIDVMQVIDGASTKPFAFLPHFPGCGVGGHCIPVDPYYLIDYAKKNGFHHEFLSLARHINGHMPAFAVECLIQGIEKKNIPIEGTKVAVLGLAYKPDIDDCRESPSYEVVKILKEKGFEVAVYDPHASAGSTVATLAEALVGAKAVFVATAHAEFRNMSPDMLIQSGVDVIMDGRNCLAKEKFLSAGLIYKGIGR